ncbi:hypothetical protein GLA29479_1125 [Lysobacter antibioticus]|nr:hypothetical protein GLA29479_1125 [Lysobacter antibioticus]
MQAALRAFFSLRACETAHSNDKIFAATATATATGLWLRGRSGASRDRAVPGLRRFCQARSRSNAQSFRH